jgi:hypothetical protein
VLQRPRDPRAFTEAVVGDGRQRDLHRRRRPHRGARSPARIRSAHGGRRDGAGADDGQPFDAPTQRGAEISVAADLGPHRDRPAAVRLVVQLDPPDESNAWYLRTQVASAGNRKLEPVDAAMSNATNPARESRSRPSSTGWRGCTRRCCAARPNAAAR